MAARIRAEGLKLPDAIVVATAILNESILVTLADSVLTSYLPQI